jgi:hypothetical protein
MGFGSVELRLWRYTVDWSKPRPLISAKSNPTRLAVAEFEPACQNEECIPQKDTNQRLGTLSDRLMYRLAYRKFADHESIVLTHTVAASGGSGIRWYELRRDLALRGPEEEYKVWQQQTFAPDNLYRWLGSIAMDKEGNILLVYNSSSATSHPSIRYTGRLASDPPNLMSNEGILVEGKRSVGADRWGDYASVSLDPVDDCTFWVTGQFLSGDNPPGNQLVAARREAQTGTTSPARPRSDKPVVGLMAPNVVTGYHWDTAIASLRFPSCR